MKLMSPSARAITGLAVLLLVISSSLLPASADHAGNLGYMETGQGDLVINYDFHSKTYSTSNIDWPVTVLFTNEAEIDRVEDDLTPWFHHKGSTKYGMLDNNEDNDDDDHNFIWDADSGKDEFDCTNSSHYRLYAPSSDQMYNTTHGYHVFAATHQNQDHYSHCDEDDEKFGWSEMASGEVRFALVYAYGILNVTANSIWMGNVNEDHWSDGHKRFWQSDGYAHEVVFPPPD